MRLRSYGWCTGLFIVLLGASTAQAQNAAPPLSCDRLTPPEPMSLAQLVAADGAPTVHAWYLNVPGPAPAGRPPAVCNPEAGNCMAAPAIPLDLPPVNVIRRGATWSCVAPSGRGYLWIASINVKPLTADPNPPLAAWIGHWTQGGNSSIEISSPDGKHLAVQGENEWHGLGDVVHYGKISGAADPISNPLTLVDDGSCVVTATAVGDYLMLHDNNQCGGANVRFQGPWRRKP